MIGKERRGEGADGKVKALGLGDVDSRAEPLFVLFRLKFTKKKLILLLAIVAFVVLLNVRMVEGLEANRCLAILIFSTILWATEVCFTLLGSGWCSFSTRLSRYLLRPWPYRFWWFVYE